MIKFSLLKKKKRTWITQFPASRSAVSFSWKEELQFFHLGKTYSTTNGLNFSVMIHQAIMTYIL